MIRNRPPMQLRAKISLFFTILLFVGTLKGLPQDANGSHGGYDAGKYKSTMEVDDQKILDEVTSHSELMTNLEYLTTRIGPRLTGSKALTEASEWALKRFRDYGIDAHIEITQIPHGWVRGNESAEILTPIARHVMIHALGWSKATPGPVTGPVQLVIVQSAADIEKLRGKLRGVILLVGNPASISSDSADNSYDAIAPPSHGVPHPMGLPLEDRLKLRQMITDERAAAVLLDSQQPNGLFTMADASFFKPADLPLAYLTHEDYALIFRLARAAPVTMKVDISSTFTAGPAVVPITVAQIAGTESPDEWVVIGGHLDSWDLGQGALDNGTGAMAVLEAARALKALGLKPRRTIVFVLSSGEEQGGLGMASFLAKHASQIPKIDAALVLDGGTGKVQGISLEGLYDTAPLMAEIYEPLREVFDLRPLSMRFFGQSDHTQFLQAGVPAYLCIQAPANYREAHHSQADTFDKVIPDQINQGAALLAAWAWNTSEMRTALPHHEAQISASDSK